MKVGPLVCTVSLAILLTACGRQRSNSTAQSTPTEEAEISTSSSASASSTSGSEPVAIEAPDVVNFDLENRENQLIKQEVLKRIDVMPHLTDEEKDKLYVQVERARAMGKVITIPFASSERELQPSAIKALTQAVKLPQVEKLSRDPTVAFVVLGYADKKGEPKINLKISTQRAQAIANLLKEKAGLLNVIHAVGMGSSEMFDSENLEKNRVAEVWAILP